MLDKLEVLHNRQGFKKCMLIAKYSSTASKSYMQGRGGSVDYLIV